MTEGRGPMIIDSIFEKREDANNYIDHQFGVMGRKSEKGWSKDKYGDWTVKEMAVFESLEEVKVNREIEDKERAELFRLKAKYG